MYHELNKKTPRRYGARAVLVVIFLAALVAGLAVLRFAFELPTSSNAHLLFNGRVIATMKTSMADRVREGMPVMATIEGFEGQKFSGVVQIIEKDSDKESTLMIKLKNPPEDIHPPVSCSVTVDNSEREAASK